MPGRIRPTHRLSATTTGEIPCTDGTVCPPGTTCGPDGVCVDGYGNPVSGETDIVGGDAGAPIDVRFHSEGVEFSRYPTGEQTDRSPAIEGDGELAILVTEGDVLSLESIAERHESYANLEVQAVKEVRGRRARPEKAIIETEDV